LTLDVSSSTGNGGRSWKTVNIVVQATGVSDGVAALQSYLNQYYTISPPKSIPPSLMLPNYNYIFTVQLCNFLGQCASKSATVQKTSDNSIPLVTIPGSSSRSMSRSQVLNILS
jgi:hypothetical protein